MLKNEGAEEVNRKLHRPIRHASDVLKSNLSSPSPWTAMADRFHSHSGNVPSLSTEPGDSLRFIMVEIIQILKHRTTKLNTSIVNRMSN